jgi:EAL domain-containing protein (putative c-di-GMP-specific phosphodiesterase class I)
MNMHGIESRELIIEVTERALIEADWTLKQLQQLDDLGLRIAVDDFGLGYSSLTYLKRFPFSILKIDKSFVAGVTHVQADQAIVRSILSLAKDLDINVVAEGVETEEQLDYLRNEGCSYVQGYHLHPPLAPSEVVSLVRSTAALNA